MALGGPQNETYLLHVLPMAKAMQYLCAMAIQNGATLIWEDESYDVHSDKVIDRARQILNFALHRPPAADA